MMNSKTKPKITIDKADRIVIPKKIRDALRIASGDVLEITILGGELKLRPLGRQDRMRKKRGVWVFRSGEPVTSELIEKIRSDILNERHDSIENPES